MADLPDGICYLAPNQYHHKGDNKPCLTTKKVVIGGKPYKVGVWPPKAGKTAYFMRIDPLEDNGRETGGSPAQSQPGTQEKRDPRPTPAPNVESSPEDFFC